jgi:hypothetical protein
MKFEGLEGAGPAPEIGDPFVRACGSSRTGRRRPGGFCANSIVIEEIRRAGYYERLWQAFAVLLPIRTVGVIGDQRPAKRDCHQAVESDDGMTADWARLPHDLPRPSAGGCSEVKGVNRVVYDIVLNPSDDRMGVALKQLPKIA